MIYNILHCFAWGYRCCTWIWQDADRVKLRNLYSNRRATRKTHTIRS